MKASTGDAHKTNRKEIQMKGSSGERTEQGMIEKNMNGTEGKTHKGTTII